MLRSHSGRPLYLMVWLRPLLHRRLKGDAVPHMRQCRRRIVVGVQVMQYLSRLVGREFVKRGEAGALRYIWRETTRKSNG